MLPQSERCVISHSSHLACALLLAVASPVSVLGQSTKIDPRLVGTWHSVEIRCAADEDCSNTVNEAQLSIGKTGSFKWVPYRDFEKFDVCTWRLSPDFPDTLDFEDCQVNPDGSSDTFMYRLSGNTLTLTGAEVKPPPTN
jgi:hypothetical protein